MQIDPQVGTSYDHDDPENDHKSRGRDLDESGPRSENSESATHGYKGEKERG